MSIKPVQNSDEFSEILGIIRAGRAKAFEAVNAALIETYWAVGAHLSRKVADASWGKGIVKELSDWLLAQAPEMKGFSASNLWRMKQFYETYADTPKLAPLVRELPWTHNLLILGQSNRPEEREFYLRLAVQAKWSKRELGRQIRSAAFERTILSDKKTRTSGASFTTGRNGGIQGQLSARFSRLAGAPQRSRSSERIATQPAEIPHGTGRRLCICRRKGSCAGGQSGF